MPGLDGGPILILGGGGSGPPDGGGGTIASPATCDLATWLLLSGTRKAPALAAPATCDLGTFLLLSGRPIVPQVLAQPATIDLGTFLMLSRTPTVAPTLARPATMDLGMWLLFGSSPTVVLPYDLVDAVVAWLRANLPSGTLPGGQHYDWAGPTADGSQRPLPYADVIRVHESRLYDSGRNYIATGMLQASVFGQSRLGSAMAADQVSATLADPQLRFQRGKIMYFRESDMRGQKDPDPGQGGGVVYQEMRMFSYQYSHRL